MGFLKKFQKHNGEQTQFRLPPWAENFHQEAEIHSGKNINSSINSICCYDVTSPLTMCPIQSLLTGLWGLVWVLKPSPCLNVSFGFILLLDLSYPIFNYCPSQAFVQCAQENPLDYSMILAPENTEEVQISDRVNSTLLNVTINLWFKDLKSVL